MRTLALYTLTAAFLVCSASSAASDPRTPATSFSIELDDVPEEKTRADLLDLFIRENQQQLRIDLVLRNERITSGRRSVLYYLEDLRVRPGDMLTIRPDGRVEPFEARIQSIEARFPQGKPPQIAIVATSEPFTPRVQARPYPLVDTEGFQGKRALKESVAGGKTTRLDDLITCLGDTPGDLRIRYHSLFTVEDVGKAFSTTYRVDEIRHRYTVQNGLQTRYFGTKHLRR